MMTIGVTAVAIAVVFAAIPALLFCANLRLYRPPPAASSSVTRGIVPAISVLIPANEECVIGAAVESVVASRGVELEVLVLDDQSDDATADIVSAIAARRTRPPGTRTTSARRLVWQAICLFASGTGGS